ncbi:MAG: SRPBCC family protein [Armatimonadetes bacterium]|nr:SRPBCC family protein [Armatimonadota bacterium]
MPDFTKSIDVAATGEEVIAFVADPKNMPKYLPTVKRASMEDEDHVHIAVEIDGEDHEDGGYLRVDGDRALKWGSEDHDYHGRIEAMGDGDGSTVTIHLHINPPPDLDKKMEEHSGGNWESRIDQGLDQALSSIKREVEARVV